MKKFLLIVSIIEFVCLLFFFDYKKIYSSKRMSGFMYYCSDYGTWLVCDRILDFTYEDVYAFEEELYDKIKKSGELPEDLDFKVLVDLDVCGTECTVYIVSDLRCDSNERIRDIIYDMRNRFYDEHSKGDF